MHSLFYPTSGIILCQWQIMCAISLCYYNFQEMPTLMCTLVFSQSILPAAHRDNPMKMENKLLTRPESSGSHARTAHQKELQIRYVSCLWPAESPYLYTKPLCYCLIIWHFPATLCITMTSLRSKLCKLPQSFKKEMMTVWCVERQMGTGKEVL